jgi:hypothetical protein
MTSSRVGKHFQIIPCRVVLERIDINNFKIKKTIKKKKSMSTQNNDSELMKKYSIKECRVVIEKCDLSNVKNFRNKNVIKSKLNECDIICEPLRISISSDDEFHTCESEFDIKLD